MCIHIHIFFYINRKQVVKFQNQGAQESGHAHLIWQLPYAIPYFANLSSSRHDDVIKWKHFPRYRPFVRGIHRSPVNSPHKGQWRRALMFSLICACIDGWVNNREAGDLRRRPTHYDITVMDTQICRVCGPIVTLRTADYNMVGVVVAMVISTMHEKLCIDSHNARKFDKKFQNSVIHTSRNHNDEITEASQSWISCAIINIQRNYSESYFLQN